MAGFVQSLGLFIKNNEDQSYLPPAQIHIGPYSILINTKLHIVVFWLIRPLSTVHLTAITQTLDCKYKILITFFKGSGYCYYYRVSQKKCMHTF